ncbi:acyl-CoA dehydrogenase family protein [Turneriella parva]|uniref:Acyl-CoA dehydrogenase domain-containing protein n=1 Tax=Turneriella parva (strain ATCC BAA-1111 / DSM 21527 / NCTC 11395 / H) TaxID=869212 RepID=I4B4U7_TURPD|nr:acyl-CoA dehydrogenase family protein [Turneriella parva]AFM12304.1 acyl-CoA dehydrogenase domain-containing protein [Turneriella parva DSM 21527]
MNLAISDRLKPMLARIEEFVTNELIPLEPQFFSKPFEELVPLLNEKRNQVKALGLWGPQIPTELGGVGLTLVEHGYVSEALGRSPLGHYVFGCQAPDAGNIEILHMFGTKEQQQEWLEPLAQGKIRSCFAMTEVDTAGSNPTLLEARAVKDGDHYVLNGRKWYTTAADGAAFAIAMMVTNSEAHPAMRASMFIVPLSTPGFGIVRNIPIMGHAGSDYNSHSEVVFENCRIPKENLLGREGAGFKIAQERLGPGRIHHCMRWLGISARAFEMLCQRANKRKIHTDGGTLADSEITQLYVAELAAELHGARLMTLSAAWAIENLGMSKARDEVAMIKFVVANTMNRIIDRALQIHGGLGMADDTILAYFFRHERAARIYDGADEVHKASLGKRLLRDYKRER